MVIVIVFAGCFAIMTLNFVMECALGFEQVNHETANQPMFAAISLEETTLDAKNREYDVRSRLIRLYHEMFDIFEGTMFWLTIESSLF